MISMVSTVPDTRSRILSTAVSPSSVYAPDAPKRLSCVNIIQINFRTSEPSTFGCIIRQLIVKICLPNAYIPVA